MSKLIQPGNSKLIGMAMFNLPASKDVCGRLCPGCYAHREQQRYPTVLPARTARYEASLQLDFVSRVRSELSSMKSPPKYFRIHASGDFYDQAYIQKWHQIITSFPNITFYAYTKRKRDFDFTPLESLPNCVIIDSLKFGRINYGELSKAPPGAFICPSYIKTTKCGETCTWCQTKGAADVKGVWFIKH